QYQCTTHVGMSRRVSKRQRRAPRPAEHQPAIDAQVTTQRLDVADEMLSGVLVHARDRRGTPGAALIEQHDPVGGGIEESPMRRVAAGAGAAMQEYHRSAGRIAAQLIDEAMTARHFEHAGFVRLDRRIQIRKFTHARSSCKAATSRSRSAAVLCRCGETRMLLPRAPTYT